jgi:putative N6-adenine-specific DNA methylase
MPYLQQEIAELGFAIEETFITGVRITGTVTDCIRLNLSLRTASQVLYSLKKFRAANADDIHRVLKDYPWETLIPDPGYFSITSNVMNDTINNNMFANLRVKDAIVDRLRDLRGARPSTGAELSGTVIHLFWKNEEAEVFADTSGDSLARHGYRRIPGRAPMLEALAVATIMGTKWDRKSPFINPMCGSGTLAIEAALLATNTRPGLFRTNFAFMHLQQFNESDYLEERGRLENQITEIPGLKIIATDYSSQAIENARKNAKAAGVDDLITFDVCDFAETDVPQGEKGIMFVNPEYGERLGQTDQLTETYNRIGDFMKKKCGGYFGYVFTGNLELAKKIGLRPSRKIEFYTSTIDCRLFEYELYEGSRRVV